LIVEVNLSKWSNKLLILIKLECKLSFNIIFVKKLVNIKVRSPFNSLFVVVTAK